EIKKNFVKNRYKATDNNKSKIPPFYMYRACLILLVDRISSLPNSK
ncbi:33033_t:CDS:1, partial [Racocetra persica]